MDAHENEAIDTLAMSDWEEASCQAWHRGMEFTGN